MPAKIKISFLVLLIQLTAIGGFIAPSQAQEQGEKDMIKVAPEISVLPDVALLKKTHPEKIVFSQYKLAQTEPDFDSLSKASPLVLNAQDIDKSAMMIAEYNRLSNSFNLYDEKTPIIIHTTLNLDEYSSLQDMIVFDELNEKTFFRFDMYGVNVGIVPENVSDFSHITISKPRAEKMFSAGTAVKTLTAEFVLIPSYADRTEPFLVNETPYWLMLARIAEFRLWANNSEKPTLVWYYRAPWYSPQQDANLEKLYAQ